MLIKKRKERKRICILKLETALNGAAEASFIKTAHTKQKKSRLQNVYLKFFNHLARLILHTHFEASARFLCLLVGTVRSLIGCDSYLPCLSRSDCTKFSNTQMEEKPKKTRANSSQ